MSEGLFKDLEIGGRLLKIKHIYLEVYKLLRGFKNRFNFLHKNFQSQRKIPKKSLYEQT